MNTSSSLLTPADLATPPDLGTCRPRCPCGAVPVFPRVGMHGDGLTHRVVPWPVPGPSGALVVRWVLAIGRRFWCPICAANVRVAHVGLRHGATFGAAVIAAILYVVAPTPIGAGGDDTRAHQLVHRTLLPVSERARSGQPRWSSLNRWVRDLEKIWPSLVLPPSGRAARVLALLAAFGLGAPPQEVLDAAIHAHARGGCPM